MDQVLTAAISTKPQRLRALDGERELLSQLATMFVEDAPELLTTLEQAVAAGDCLIARRTVHSLKGLAATFYACLRWSSPNVWSTRPPMDV